MGVFADHVFLEEPIGAGVGRRGQADQEAVENYSINLPPQIVNGAMTFIDDDHIKEFRRDLGVIWQPGSGSFAAVHAFGGMFVFGAFEAGLRPSGSNTSAGWWKIITSAWGEMWDEDRRWTV